MAKGKFVAYYRVSTQRQGRSGLGLDGQRKAVTDYLNGGNWQLVAEFTEVESGAKNDRPQLLAALAACRVYGATLVVAKIDRLSRDAAFLLTLRDSGVDFVAADMPEANRLTVGILALVAEQERAAISARTKAALAAAKRRGVKLGNPENLTRKGQLKGSRKGNAAKAAKADARARDLAAMVEQLRAEGAASLRQLAAGLNDRGVPTPRGGEWSPMQVQRLLQRLSFSA